MSRSALTELLKKPKAPLEWGEKYNLWVHDDFVSTEELFINPEVFPNLLPGEYIRITNPLNCLQVCLQISLSPMERAPFKQRSFHVSLHRKVADNFGFKARQDAYVIRLEREQISNIEHAVIVFRDQYIGRIPLMELRDCIKDKMVQVGKDIDLSNACIKAHIVSIQDEKGQTVSSGMVDRNFTVAFYSQTAKFSILLQISSESLQIAPHGDGNQTYLDLMLDGFVRELFEKWREAKVDHLVSIVFFSKAIDRETVGCSEDFYSVVAHWVAHDDWNEAVMDRLRKEAINLINHITKVRNMVMVEAKHGNFLEAMHLSLTIFDKHYVDRDLSKTGMSIILVSPGNGQFVINGAVRYKLGRMTKRRVVDEGIWLQLVCLGRPESNIPVPSITININNENAIQQNISYYPYWIKCGFYNCSSAAEGVSSRGDSENQSSSNRTTSCSPQMSASSVASLSPTTSLCNERLLPPGTPSTPKAFCLVCSSKWSLLNEPKERRFVAKLPDWRTLISPPCLPLRIKLDINPDILERHFELTQKYTVTLNQLNTLCPTSSSIFLTPNANTRNLLMEMYRVRIALGMQDVFYTPFRNNYHTLIFHHEVHILEMQSSSDDEMSNGVNVLIYTKRKPKNISVDQQTDTSIDLTVEYGANIKNIFSNDFEKRNFTLKQSSIMSQVAVDEQHSWERVDNMIGGNEGRRLIKEAKYWQSRFVLIPTDEPPRSSLIMSTAANEILDDEEVRVAGFFKFVELIHRSALSRPTSIPNEDGEHLFEPLKSSSFDISASEFLKINLTTLRPSQYIAAELDKIHNGGIGSGDNGQSRPVSPVGGVKSSTSTTTSTHQPALTQGSPLELVSIYMQHPLVGLNIKNRQWHSECFRNVFLGNMAVDWIINYIEGVEGREEAIEYGNYLIDMRVWEHIYGTHRFLDGYYFYRFTQSFEISNLRSHRESFASQLSGSVLVNDLMNIRSINRQQDQSTNESATPTGSSSKAIIMSRSLLINVDYMKRNVGRREWAILHYDSIHNPKLPFHFRINWLTCSSRLVDDLIQFWARRAMQCGFTMLEVPVQASPLRMAQLPFNATHFIPYSVPPPRCSSNGEEYYWEALVQHFDFFLDSEATDISLESSIEGGQVIWSYEKEDVLQCTQYVHKSGIAIVQVSEKGLYWCANRLLLASTVTRAIRPLQSSQFHEQSHALWQSINDLCSDPLRLQSFWDQVQQACDISES